MTWFRLSAGLTGSALGALAGRWLAIQLTGIGIPWPVLTAGAVGGTVTWAIRTHRSEKRRR